MESKNTFILHETEAFMRGELDNVTVAHGRIVLDLVSGGHVPYGCYTSPAVPLPTFDALRVSWNAGTPPGTAVEAQARVMVDGNWTSWSSFGRWSPYLEREGAAPVTKGAVNLLPDSLVLDSKTATQAQLRIYLYTKDEHTTPSVSLVGVSVRAVDVIPAGGRPINARLHLMPYAVARRAPVGRDLAEIAALLHQCILEVYGQDISMEALADSFYYTYRLRRLFTSRHGVRRAFYWVLELFFGGRGFITGHVSPAHLKLNLPEDWTDPATGEERHGGAFALLKDAQHRCELFMTAALGHWMGKLDEEILEKTLGSMSYITGTETEQSKSQQAPDAEQAGETA